MTGRRQLLSLALALLLVVTLAAPRVAAAQDEDDVVVPERPFGFAEKGKSLTITLSFTDVFDARLLEELDSGITTTIVLRAYVYREGGEGLPVSFAAATLRVVYDLWAETYEIQIDDPRGRRKYVESSKAEALKRVTTLAAFPVAPLGKLPIGEIHFIGLIVEVNPVSEELLAEVRRWLARDADKQRVGGESSFFGSFVSIFVNPKIPVADRVLRLRSKLFYRQKR